MSVNMHNNQHRNSESIIISYNTIELKPYSSNLPPSLIASIQNNIP